MVMMLMIARVLTTSHCTLSREVFFRLIVSEATADALQ